MEPVEALTPTQREKSEHQNDQINKLTSDNVGRYENSVQFATSLRGQYGKTSLVDKTLQHNLIIIIIIFLGGG